MMNRSFVLVAVLGLCSISLAAPAAGLQGVIETLPFPTTSVLSSDSATSSLVATATSTAVASGVNFAPAPVVVHGGAPETDSIIEGLRGSAGSVFRRAPPSSDVIDALRAEGLSSGTFARDDVEVRDPHGYMGAGAPDTQTLPAEFLNTANEGHFNHRRQDIGARDLEAVSVNVDSPRTDRIIDTIRVVNTHRERDLSGACSRWNARDCRRQESSDKNLPGAPEFDPILSQLRQGATFFRRSQGETSQNNARQEAPAPLNTNLPGAPEFDPILSQLRQGATVFRRSPETFHNDVREVTPSVPTNLPGAPEFDPILSQLRQGATVFRRASSNSARQVTSPTPNNLPGAPEFDPILSQLRQGATVFRRSSADVPRDEPHQLVSGVSDENLHGLPEVDPILSRLRQGTEIFPRVDGEVVTTGRRQDSQNLPGAPEFDPILSQLRQGAVFFRASEDSEEEPISRREPSPYGSMGGGAPFVPGIRPDIWHLIGRSSAVPRDELESRNFGGQAIPVGKSDPELLKALWGRSQ